MPHRTGKRDHCKQAGTVGGSECYELVLVGLGASKGQATGQVVILLSPADLPKMKQGDVLVTTMTTPLYTPALLKACAVVTNLGGILSHAAVVARELGIPCVVGTGNATEMLKDGEEVMVDGSKGYVYRKRDR